MELPFPLSASSRSTSASVSRQVHLEASKIELCCELQLKADAQVGFQAMLDAATLWLASSGLTVALGRHDPQLVGVPLLAQTCLSICIEPALPRGSSLLARRSGATRDQRLSAAFVGSCRSSAEINPLVFPYYQANITVLPYTLHEGAEEGGVAEVGEEGRTHIFRQWALPNKEFGNLWESIHFDEAIKETLLEYSATALLFSDRSVDSKASEKACFH